MTKFYLQKSDGSHEQVSEAEFRDIYGDFVIRNLTPDVPGWRLVALKDKIDAPSGTSVFVMGDENTYEANLAIQMYYSSAPVRPGSAPPNGLPVGVTARGDIGYTDYNGHCGWGWDGDAYYWPKHPNDPAKRRGPYCFWVADGKNSASIDGVGMIGNTNHRRFHMKFMWSDGQPMPSDPLEVIANHVDAIARLLEGLTL